MSNIKQSKNQINEKPSHLLHCQIWHCNKKGDQDEPEKEVQL